MIRTPHPRVKARAHGKGSAMVIRVRKQDSAYVYQVLESYEGLTNYSTIPSPKGTPHCDIQLHIAPDLRGHVEDLITRLATEISIERL
jgi:hypothetical protein